MIRKAFKVAAAGLVYHSGILSLTESLRNREAGTKSCIVLTYHRVMPLNCSSVPGDNWERFRSLPGIVVSPEMFDAQVSFLCNHYNLVPLSELLSRLDIGDAIPERMIAITFDDGWRDNHKYAFPVLKKYRVPATIFLSMGFIESNKIFWPERVIDYFTGDANIRRNILDDLGRIVPATLHGVLSKISGEGNENLRSNLVIKLIEEVKHLSPPLRNDLFRVLDAAEFSDSPAEIDARVMLNWDEIKEMHAAGIEFGSHCVDHELLTEIGNDERERELSESHRLLKEKLSPSTYILAYPNGDYDDQVKELARSIGYQYAFAASAGHITIDSDRYALPRINVHDGNSRGLCQGFSKSLFECHIHMMFR